MTSPASQDEPQRDQRQLDALFAVLLLGCSLAVYARAVQGDFVSYDDGVYVTENSVVQSGLNTRSVAWAFTNDHSGNWQPLTWLSHMLDCEVFGMAPWGHHLTNILLHAMNAALLYLALKSMTRSTGASLFVAAFFALHPAHVESVAWVSERKDVLSVFFGLLALLAYAAYARKPRWTSYTLFVGCYTLSLLAKPMLVTLPVVLLLLDFWPLGRMRTDGHGLTRTDTDAKNARGVLGLIVEKLPLFVLAGGVSLVTFLTQRSAMSSLEGLPFSMRLSNAAIAYWRYIYKALWPFDLAAFYPHPRETISPAVALIAAAGLVAVTLVAILLRRRSPHFLTGWLWFLITLLPVIGIIQVGVQAMADRYSYMPFVGLGIVAAWGIPQAMPGGVARRVVLTALALALAGLWSWRTVVQVGYWRDSETLFRHSLAVTGENEVALNGLANALIAQARLEDALPYLERAARMNATNAETFYNLGTVYQGMGRSDSAIAYYQQAIQVNPRYSRAYNNLGVTLMGQNRHEEAAQALRKALEADATNVEALSNYGAALLSTGRLDEAEAHLRSALERFPEVASLHNNLGAVLAAKGEVAAAREAFAEALRLDPGFPEAQRGLDAMNAIPRTHGAFGIQ
ncbi:MAG: tetratricopeptide repeat protein [Candidatus Hydrogenedentes bacterium]|nr:tetratricopeptide repeat protein [Candidatus Hydrogenedentota bacterium]